MPQQSCLCNGTPPRTATLLKLTKKNHMQIQIQMGIVVGVVVTTTSNLRLNTERLIGELDLHPGAKPHTLDRQAPLRSNGSDVRRRTPTRKV
jgi:hypothetical protein